MDENRKEIIVEEIKKWKDSRLLPEHYCNFLLTLYTEGERDNNNRKKNIVYLSIFQFGLPFILLSIFLVIYFTDLSIVIQATAGLLLIVISLYIAKKTPVNELLFSYSYYLIAALLFYLLTIQLIIGFFDANHSFIMSATAIHCLIWLIIGLRWRIYFFIIASVLGLITLVSIII